MPHLAMSKGVAWPTLIFALVLVGICIAAHFYPWLKQVCDALKSIAGLGLLAVGAIFAFKTASGGGAGGGTP
jgi:hypothetical protein